MSTQWGVADALNVGFMNSNNNDILICNYLDMFEFMKLTLKYYLICSRRVL